MQPHPKSRSSFSRGNRLRHSNLVKCPSKQAGRGVVAGVRLCGTVQVGLTAKSGFSVATLASLDQRLSLCAVSLVPSLV